MSTGGAVPGSPITINVPGRSPIRLSGSRDQAEALREQIRLLDERQAEAEATMAFREREAEWIQQNKEAELEAMEARSEMMARLRDEERASREAEAENLRRKIGAMEGYAGAFMTVGSAVSDVFGQLASSEEEGSEAAKRYAKTQGSILAAMSFVNAAIEVARAVGSYPDVIGIAAHAASAAAYIVAGGMAISQLGGDATAPATSAAAPTSSYVPEQATKGESAGAPSGAYVQILTMGGTSARLGQEMLRAERDMQRAGLDGYMSGGGGWSQ
jgi:hypothetical protein